MADKRVLIPKSKPHPLLAAFFDFYFIAIFLMALIALGTIIFSKPIFTIQAAGLTFLGTVLVVVFYHIFLNKMVKMLSVGERIAGKILISNKKMWVNPYNKNRWLLFLLIVVTLLLLGNDWDALETNVIPLGIVVGKILKAGLVFIGFLMIGNNKISGVFIPFSIFAINTILYFIIFISSKDNFILGFASFYLLISIGYLAVYFVYKNKK